MRRTLALSWLSLAAFAILLLSGCGLFGGAGHHGPPPGDIIFGAKAYRQTPYQWAVKNQSSTFRDGKWIGWLAQLKRPLGTTTVTIQVSDVTSNRVLYTQTISGLKPKYVELANPRVPVDSFVKAAGTTGRLPITYILSYLVNGEVLAEGTFKVSR